MSSAVNKSSQKFTPKITARGAPRNSRRRLSITSTSTISNSTNATIGTSDHNSINNNESVDGNKTTFRRPSTTQPNSQTGSNPQEIRRLSQQTLELSQQTSVIDEEDDEKLENGLLPVSPVKHSNIIRSRSSIPSLPPDVLTKLVNSKNINDMSGSSKSDTLNLRLKSHSAVYKRKALDPISRPKLRKIVDTNSTKNNGDTSLPDVGNNINSESEISILPTPPLTQNIKNIATSLRNTSPPNLITPPGTQNESLSSSIQSFNEKPISHPQLNNDEINFENPQIPKEKLLNETQPSLSSPSSQKFGSSRHAETGQIIEKNLRSKSDDELRNSDNEVGTLSQKPRGVSKLTEHSETQDSPSIDTLNKEILNNEISHCETLKSFNKFFSNYNAKKNEKDNGNVKEDENIEIEDENDDAKQNDIISENSSNDDDDDDDDDNDIQNYNDNVNDKDKNDNTSELNKEILNNKNMESNLKKHSQKTDNNAEKSNEIVVSSDEENTEEEDEVDVFDTSKFTTVRRSARLRLISSPISFKPLARGPLISRNNSNRSTKRITKLDKNNKNSRVKKPPQKNARKSAISRAELESNQKNDPHLTDEASSNDKDQGPSENLLKNIGSCSFIKYHRNPTLESPLILSIKDNGIHDDKGRILVGPDDIPKRGRGHGPFVISNTENVAINPEQFTMADLCSPEFFIGEEDEEFTKYESAKLERRRKKEDILVKKKVAREKGHTLREIQLINDGSESKINEDNNELKEFDFENLVDTTKTQPAAPQLTMVDGKFVIESTEVDRHRLAESAFNGPDGDTRVREVVNKYDEFHNSSSFGKHKRTEAWTDNETNLFYEALSTWGTDFSIISGLFPGRTRRHIRNKFKYEEKLNPTKLELALIRKMPCDLDGYSVISGKEMLSIQSVTEEINDINRQFEQQLAVEFENKVKAKADDDKKAMMADEAAFGTTVSNSFQEVRTFRKTKAQLRRELRQNEVVLGSIDDL